MTLVLEVGKKYLRRDGGVVEIVTDDKDSNYRFISKEGLSYTPEGFYRYAGANHIYDIVSHYAPEIQTTSDGSTASYYELPNGASELQDLISHRDMNAQIGEIFRACYRYGIASHSDRLRDAKKIRFYAEAEIKRLESL